MIDPLPPHSSEVPSVPYPGGEKRIGWFIVLLTMIQSNQEII
ncbi:hypothetical protein SAMN05192559_101212 [Halobacillus karajensis]|uniref:Uncharacterized protein n=1 Tax=Halobacillus karajensis TaxID=195088 RepID=A0A024P4P1_9BACI|nr:hypothetical protein BN982_01419 [Halobacillus karajensis]CDQ22791.1 hypothetical protein BN983_01007 [Halobacillus karajensis]CDQ26273.1 hypothetical protein BN981_00487 [Halobacillus karajensis]SEH41083.1 hypothetical protein SAMN05192559_101212 [Halobacillus karajensis]